jgi:hypothetical protein
VIIDEVEPENWGFAGVLTPEYRRLAAASASDDPASASSRAVAADVAQRSSSGDARRQSRT